MLVLAGASTCLSTLSFRGGTRGLRILSYTRPVIIRRLTPTLSPYISHSTLSSRSKLLQCSLHPPRPLLVRYVTSGEGSEGVKNVSKWKETQNRVVGMLKEYGAVGVAFYMTLSFSVLGICYLAVRAGVDVESLLSYLKIDSSRYSSASTFAVAYLIYKLLFPVRAAVTLTCLPFIVRFLRSKGLMKPKQIPRTQ